MTYFSMKLAKAAVFGIGVSLVSGCIATVQTANAPVDRGNINSKGFTLGEVHLVNIEAKTINDVGDNDAMDTYLSTRGKTITKNQGDLSVGFTSGVKISYDGVPIKYQPQASINIQKSIQFHMDDFVERSTRYTGAAILNSKELATWRAEQGRFATDNYRFVFIRKTTTAKSVKTTWGTPENVVGGDIDFKVGSQSVTVKGGFSSAFNCSGEKNQCVVQAEILKLKKNSDTSGATGLVFVLDDETSAKDFIYKNAGN